MASKAVVGRALTMTYVPAGSSGQKVEDDCMALKFAMVTAHSAYGIGDSDPYAGLRRISCRYYLQCVGISSNSRRMLIVQLPANSSGILHSEAGRIGNRSDALGEVAKALARRASYAIFLTISTESRLV